VGVFAASYKPYALIPNEIRFTRDASRDTVFTLADFFSILLRPTEAYMQSVEKAAREQPRRARGSDEAIMNSPGQQ
jgi:hypothetical protein